ncbi:hypothetical protein SPRG_18126 [Saprolegnia parasitica CBS 223.65]|uniref:Uncharacterized protein n=1 Tax=Saprolegnia parasitica (strain CBS 223.65) TaxID=695850 RepID=A0A067BNS0_SAPPC|nr:hypothetical protein SPRG_18126 [Saprolegnia parasitica CBS 223.65]KDO16342.1 hypothetical protein SPRG_18126 [Saprolegnia parasitica CBS 223.65]|eukprot:XP_012212950.1 hypothetical protein SPRG_18126 [Saprolegnia parasitica CBS 223.65]
MAIVQCSVSVHIFICPAGLEEKEFTRRRSFTAFRGKKNSPVIRTPNGMLQSSMSHPMAKI